MKRINKKLLTLLAAVPLVAMLASCSPFTLMNSLTTGAASQISPNLAYGTGDRARLDVYRPLAANGKAPVVLFFYGGIWSSGERADYAFVGNALASRGIVAVIADYRLYPEVHYPDFLVDSAQAAAWTVREVAKYGGDPKRIFVMGHSAGAYNAAMLALDKKWMGQQGLSASMFRGWIGLAGPYDFLPIDDPQARLVFDFPATPPSSQPINFVSAASPPALLIAAQTDHLVNPMRNTGGMARRLRENGIAVSEIYFGRVSHTTLVGSLSAPLRMLAPTLDSIEQFVNSDGRRIAQTSQASPEK